MAPNIVPLVGATLAVLTLAARAQDASAYDPAQLPAYHGQVQLFTLTPRGDIDGVVLTDGTEVKTPPHLSTQMALAVRPGDTVTVHGLKAAKLPLIQAMSVTNDRDGKSVVDRGPGPIPGNAGGEAFASRAITGQVRMALHGPRGEVNGVLLADGTILKLPPPDIDRFKALLSPGRSISAEGSTRVSVAGTVVDVSALGPSPEQLQPVE
jgi:hypothetical protein